MPSLVSRAVVLESGLGLESGLEKFFYRLGLVLDSLVFGLGLVSDLVIGLAKCSSWSRPSPAIYASFFLFQNKDSLVPQMGNVIAIGPDSRRFSIVSDLSWTRWYLDSDLSRTWSLDSPNVQVGLDRVQQYMLLFFSFKTKTRLFRKWVM